MSRRLGLLSATVSGVVVACTAFGSGDVPGPEPLPDAAPTDEAGSDSPASGTDSGAIALKEAGCSATPTTFCDDFDTEVAPTPKWTPLRVGSGTIDFDSTRYVSAPNALRIALPAGVAPGTIAELQYTTPDRAGHTTVDLDLFPDTVGDAGSPSVLEIVGNPGTNVLNTARLIARSSDLSLEIFDYKTDPSNAQKITLLSTGLEPKTWTHVTLTLDLSIDGTASTVSASVPGLATPIDKKLIAVTFPASMIRVSVGLNNVTTYEAWTYLFDNVAITVK